MDWQDRVRTELTKRGISQSELARQMNLNKSTVSIWLNDRAFSHNTIKRRVSQIASALQIPESEIFDTDSVCQPMMPVSVLIELQGLAADLSLPDPREYWSITDFLFDVRKYGKKINYVTS